MWPNDNGSITCWEFTEPRAKDKRPLREIFCSMVFHFPKCMFWWQWKEKMKHKTYTFFFFFFYGENEPSVSFSFPSCVSWPKPIFLLFPQRGGLKLGAGFHSPYASETKCQPVPIRGYLLMVMSEVDSISGPSCRHLWAISGKLLPNSHILW